MPSSPSRTRRFAVPCALAFLLLSAAGVGLDAAPAGDAPLAGLREPWTSAGGSGDPAAALSVAAERLRDEVATGRATPHHARGALLALLSGASEALDLDAATHLDLQLRLRAALPALVPSETGRTSAVSLGELQLDAVEVGILLAPAADASSRPARDLVLERLCGVRPAACAGREDLPGLVPRLAAAARPDWRLPEAVRDRFLADLGLAGRPR